MENNVKVKTNKLTIILIGISILLTLSAIMLTTYAFFNYTRTGAPNIIKTGKINLKFTDGDNSLFITNQFPIPDNEAYNMKSNGEEVVITDFTVSGFSSSTSLPLKYKVTALKGNNEEGMNRFKDSEVKLYLVGETNDKGSFTIENGYGTADAVTGKYGELASVGNSGIDTSNGGEILLATGQVDTEATTHEYTLRMWISDKVKISDTDSSYTYCASTSECNDTRNVYSTLYYSLRIKVESLDME